MTIMAYWLFKEEPEHYNFGRLEQEQTTWWNGVANNLARLHLRKVKKGDRIFFYHSGREKSIVGEMRAIGDARAEPENPDARAVVVEVRSTRRLPRPVSLARIKQDPLLADWELVRLTRLSVMPVSERQWRRVEELSLETSDGGKLDKVTR